MIFTPFKTSKHLHSIAARSAFAGLVLPLLFTAAAANGQQLASPQLAGTHDISDINLEPDVNLSLLREEFGPYDEALSEALRQLGRRYQESGQHELALDFLKDAWQISKVNHGIYSADQVPTLELIIYSEMELQRWESVDNHYAYLELLHRRIYRENDPQLELGLQKVSAWHVHALSIRDSSKQVTHLRKAYHLLKDRLELAEANLDLADPKFGYLRESIQITEQRLRLIAQKDNGLLWQPSIAGSSLLADSY
jgi:tetratricopeptide (TPR) repeat protein